MNIIIFFYFIGLALANNNTNNDTNNDTDNNTEQLIYVAVIVCIIILALLLLFLYEKCCIYWSNIRRNDDNVVDLRNIN
tara:strand:- start:1489 stop:1725 length:237 start_codon:yes stop_codon:yes gene_type:complete